MKAVITKIESGKVWALHDWQAAESERIELQVHPEDYILSGDSTCWIDNEEGEINEIEVGQQITVEREGDYWRIVNK